MTIIKKPYLGEIPEGYSLVSGTDCIYIDREGNAASTFRGRWWPLRPSMSQYGYPVVNLAREGKTKRPYFIHRLVTETHLPNPGNLPFVNHIDGNKLNNKLENLEWCTHLQNQQHGWLVGDYKPHFTPKSEKLDLETLAVIYTTPREVVSHREMARRLGTCHTIVAAIRSKKRYVKEIKSLGLA